MKPTPAIDLAHRLLYLLGWSVGETGFKRPDSSHYWLVDAKRDGQVIIATADSQAMAWWECWQQAQAVGTTQK